MSRGKEVMERLIRGAMGEIKADLIVTGAKLVNVYTGEIIDGVEIAVLDGRICYVGPRARHAQGEATEVLDAGGCWIAPGFIDAHTHIGHYCRPYEHLQSYLPRGTTALVASCDELGTVFGTRGMKFFLDEVETHPLRVYTLLTMVAPQDPWLCNTATFTDSEVAAALDDPRVLGMGEIVSWLRLLQCDGELLERLAAAHRRGQIIHGHTAGARDQKLCAVAAAGISSCHEPIQAADALERLRLGYWTMLREGSLRQDLAATLKPLIERGISLQRLILVTDSMLPDDVAERGHMDHVIRRAISLGMSPVQAIQAVTLNAATYSSLEQDIGGIAPGRFADLVLLDDLAGCRVKQTLIGGKVVARDGISLMPDCPLSPPEEMFHSFKLSPAVALERFKVPCPKDGARIRVMELLNQTITAEKILGVEASCGFIEASPANDLMKVAMFDRHGGSGKPAIGFLMGLGAKVGAIGLTVNLDENTLMVVGSDDADMGLCADALIEWGGGVAVVDGGEVLAKIELPLGGLSSLAPWREVGGALSRIQRCLRERGSLFPGPLCPLIFLSFVTLPSLRITSRGLVNAKERRIVSLFVD